MLITWYSYFSPCQQIYGRRTIYIGRRSSCLYSDRSRFPRSMDTARGGLPGACMKGYNHAVLDRERR
jgi:hypothetical protein